MDLQQLASIQDDLNTRTITNWRNRLTLSDFNMAIISEFAELTDSGRKWKWWKKAGEINEWNEKIEIIDIFHFVLSKLLIFGGEINGSATGVDSENSFKTPCLLTVDGSFHNGNMTQCLESMLDDSDHYVLNGMNAIFNSWNMTEKEITLIYHLKASLNYVRQRTGYTTGEYNKILNGREDNEFLKELFLSMINESPLRFDEVQDEVDKVFNCDRL